MYLLVSACIYWFWQLFVLIIIRYLQCSNIIIIVPESGQFVHGSFQNQVSTKNKICVIDAIYNFVCLDHLQTVFSLCFRVNSEIVFCFVFYHEKFLI